ncbi:MAG: heavy metal translocating P-type ATPase, partial [Anaerolineaceae bacterium]|nr:heavy metal translocating P-type ATPase [Anaerolineaceae bacterium]
RGVEELQIGDRILVKPGERIPMDGTVAAGFSSVNQAPITGESLLSQKEVGSQVFASSINGEGSLEIEVTHLSKDNTISKLIKMVEEAQEKRAPTQRFVDRFASYYTPAVIALAVLVALIPPLFFGQPFLNLDDGTYGWLYRGLALLVVGCPCALVISTPVTIISGISNAARQGVLIKGGAHLEDLSRVNAIAFDKTGTLTNGRPSVVDVRARSCECQNKDNGRCEECSDLIALAGMVELASEHPLASAILDEMNRLNLQERYPAAELVTAITGLGVTGRVDSHQITIGSHDYFDFRFPHLAEFCEAARDDASKGFTSLMISKNEEYIGTIAVADTVRDSSREALDMLKAAGMKELVMLTGDNPDVARVIGEKVGVTEVKAGLLPEHKVIAIKELQDAYGPVAMVGDGINDAPALATADVGIAIGGAFGGTAQAMETADITLMSDNLRRLPFTINLSRSTMQIIKFNVAFSLAVKFIFFVLVLLGLGSMLMAVFADMGTSLLVTLNGMRLLNKSLDGKD